MAYYPARYHPDVTVAELPAWQRFEIECACRYTLSERCLACGVPLTVRQARTGSSFCNDGCLAAYGRAGEVAQRLRGAR